MAVARRFSAAEHVTLALRLADLYRKSGRETEIEPLFRRIRLSHSDSPQLARLG